MSAARRWRIPLALPDIDDSDRAAVLRVLTSDVLSLGPEAETLEAEFAARLAGSMTALVSSGTAGLFLALRALGVAGGEVITPSYGFIATAHAIRLAGATPRFADIDPQTLGLTPETIDAAWTSRTAALLPVHVFGTAARMPQITRLGADRGVPVIEDACEALGSTNAGRPAGTWGHAGVFAFYPNKQMTTGEGGLVVARDDEVIRRVRSMRNQGRGDGDFVFTGDGFNFRMTELQAALGRSQLARLDAFLAARARVAAAYRARLRVVRGIHTLGEPAAGDRRGWFVFPVFVDDPGWRAPLRDALSAAGIQTSAYFPPIHSFAPFADPSLRAGPLPVTEAVAARSFALPFHNRLAPEEIDEVSGVIADTLAPLARGRATLSWPLEPTPVGRHA